jgi:CDP-glucose 4,6-dehydratase
VYDNSLLSIRNPGSIRPWQYVLEALYGYLLMGVKMTQDDKYLGAYNFGPDVSDSMSVKDVVESAISIL